MTANAGSITSRRVSCGRDGLLVSGREEKQVKDSDSKGSREKERPCYSQSSSATVVVIASIMIYGRDKET